MAEICCKETLNHALISGRPDEKAILQIQEADDAHELLKPIK
jgi:hypothetical protein